MKKMFFIFAFVFFSIFTFNMEVNANVHTGISYDANEHFNIFYEIKNNTKMANLLLSKDISSLGSYLGSTISSYNSISIYYYKDFKPSSGLLVGDDPTYVILVSNNSLSITKESDLYTISIGGNYGMATGYTDVIVLNSNAKVIYKTVLSEYKDIPSISYEFSNTNKTSIENFSYFISSLWYSKTFYRTGLFEDTYVTDVLYDNERLLIDDSEVNKNIFTKIKEKWLGLFNSDNLIDARQLNLTYFQKESYMTDTKVPISTYNILNYDNSVVPPRGFSSLNFKVNDKIVDAYFFIPKNLSSSYNRNLYGYTTSLPNKSFLNDDSGTSIKQGVQAFSINDKNIAKVLSDKYVDYHVNYEQNYKLYDLEYKQKLSKLYSDINFNSTIISISHAIKYDSILYYNPNAFTVCPLYSIDSDTYSTCSFVNPVNNEEITLSGEEFYNLAASGNGLGVSSNIFDDAETQRETADKYSELYEKDENGNITGFSLTNVLQNLTSFLKNFTSVVSTIFSSFTMFFNSLPVEVRGLLYFSLIGGAIILFWKLIH